MIQKVWKYIEQEHMIEEGDCVVAGVSGGADSVCLLLVLLELRKKIAMDLRAVHINHLIREDAAKDAAYVEQLCFAHNIPFTLVEEDVEKLAQESHCSTEEAGRMVRYCAFEKELGSKKGKIAVAHNKNDTCETFLFHLFRGSSLKGLSGIRPIRDRIIRPLLCLDRKEIEAFLKERNVDYCIDSTNLEDNYTRNKIRHHIMETAEKEICPESVNHIYNACGRISEAYDLIEDLARQGYMDCVTVAKTEEKEKYHINQERFLRLHRTIQGYVLMEVLSKAAGSRKDIESIHIRQVGGLMNKQCGKMVELPYHLYAKRDYAGIYITQKEIQKSGSIGLEEQRILITDTIENTAIGEQKWIQARILQKKDIDLQNIPQKKYTKWIDYDKIKDNLVVRTRRQGDYLTVNTLNQRKTLKAYFVDNKIPQEERSRIFLVAEGNHIIWIVGGRISSYYKVSESTEHILCLSFIDEAITREKDCEN